MELKDLFRLRAGGEEVEWGVNRFPDGQIQFWCTEVPTSLYASLPTSEALDLVLQILSATTPEYIQINYLYGARSDKSKAGDRTVANVAKLVIDLIRSASPKDFKVVSPHSEVFLSPEQAIWPVHPEILANEPGYDLVVFPDASAHRRFDGRLGGIPSVTCQKERDQVTGEILRHEIPSVASGARVLVADDLCDGGRTFLDVARALPNGTTADLYITHGVFSNGAVDKLLDLYRTIWVTNSLPYVNDLATDRVRVLDVWSEDWS